MLEVIHNANSSLNPIQLLLGTELAQSVHCTDRHSAAWCQSSIKHQYRCLAWPVTCSSIQHPRHWRQQCGVTYSVGLIASCSRICRTSTHCQLPLACWTHHWLLFCSGDWSGCSPLCSQEVYVIKQSECPPVSVEPVAAERDQSVSSPALRMKGLGQSAADKHTPTPRLSRLSHRSGRPKYGTGWSDANL